MAIQIDNSVPTPVCGRGRPRIWPFDVLVIGESFTVPEEQAVRMRLGAANFKHRNPGWNYTTRTEDGGNVRVWRTA